MEIKVKLGETIKKGHQKISGDEFIEKILYLWAYKHLVGPGHPRQRQRKWQRRLRPAYLGQLDVTVDMY